MSAVTALSQRPFPPAALIELNGAAGQFVPALSLMEWIRDAFLDAAGGLHWSGHSHLREATIGCLWTTAENTNKGRSIVGQAEMTTRGGGGGWSRARSAQQRREWFGQDPLFLLTFDAYHAATVDNATFAALVDHELCHCAQVLDDFGSPAFNSQTGEPLFTIRGHDVEEFVSVVERFGVAAAGPDAVDLVIAASRPPSIAPSMLAAACGTCNRKAA